MLKKRPMSPDDHASCPPRSMAAIDKAVQAASDIINARLSGMEKAFEVFQNDLTRVPTTVDRQISALKDKLEERLAALDDRVVAIKDSINHVRDLADGRINELSSVTGERFTAVGAQFSERDTRTDQRAGDTKLAVDAAFAAAKEATSKIEAGFTKQIDAMISILDTKTANLDMRLADLKDRVTAMENRSVGSTVTHREARDDRNDMRGFVFGVVGVVVGLGAFVLTILMHLMVPVR